MRRALLIAGLVALAAAPAAAARDGGCAVPAEPGHNSCLATVHDPLPKGEVLLAGATPRLVVRLRGSCPRRVARRTVTLRAGDGRRLARRRVTGRCRAGVARWTVKLRPDVDLPAGTVVRTRWSGLRPGSRAPSVRLGEKPRP